MSVLLNTTNWGTVQQRQHLLSRLTFTVQPDERYAPKEVRVYTILKNRTLFVCPFSIGQLDEYRSLRVHDSQAIRQSWESECKRGIVGQPQKQVKSTRHKKAPPPTPTVLDSPVFHGTLTVMQEGIYREVWDNLTRSHMASLLHVATGFGKTFLSVYLSMKVYEHVKQMSSTNPSPLLTVEPFVVMIVVHRAEIQKQWVQTIHERLPNSASVQVLNRKDPFTPSTHPLHFLVINVVNIDHRWTPELPFHCHFLILDECHAYCTDQALLRLLSLRPQYLLGLSATPDRSDGRSQALDMIVSPRIVRKMRRLFHVYHYHTPWKGQILLSPSTGELDWNSILEGQATNTRRNRLICEFIHLFWRAERTILVLCKRVEQTTILQTMLENTRGTFIASEVLVGNGLVSNQPKDVPHRPRVLLSTYSMVGVGFSDDRLDTLILGADVEQMALQYAGRIFRRPDVSSVIVDIVDPKMPGMRKHFRSRCAVYESMGGIIEAFEDAHDCRLLPIDLNWD